MRFGFFCSKSSSPAVSYRFAGVRLFVRQIRPEVIATAYVRTLANQLDTTQQRRVFARHLHRQIVDRIGYR